MDEAKRLGEYNSVGGSATHILFNFPGYGALYMGSLMSISYSTFRDKTPVYTLGGTNIDGFAMGKRYIAGSIIKTFFMNDDLKQFLTKIKTDIGIQTDIDNLYRLNDRAYKTYHNLLIDDIVPFDIIIVLCSEYGDWSVSEVIYGATFINTGQVYSIADIVTETTMSFIANDVRMTHDSLGKQISSLMPSTMAVKASTLKSNNSSISESSNGTPYYVKLSYQEVLELVEDGSLPRSALSEWKEHNRTIQSGNGNLEYSFSNKSEVPDSNPYKTAGSQNIESNTLSQDTVRSSNLSGGVNSIHDGDTLSFKTTNKDGKNTTVELRLIGIDTPEIYNSVSGKTTYTQPLGLEAQEAIKGYISAGNWDRDVELGYVRENGVDVYGRKLYVNPNLIEYMVANGYSYPMLNSAATSSMTTSELSRIEQAAIRAKENKIGLYGLNYPVISPSDWRKMNSKEQMDYLESVGQESIAKVHDRE